MTTTWLPDTCTNCGGHTILAEWNGDYDIVDCHKCNAGIVWVSPKDRIAGYPGGPFQGSRPGRYAELQASDRAKQVAEMERTGWPEVPVLNDGGAA